MRNGGDSNEGIQLRIIIMFNIVESKMNMHIRGVSMKTIVY